MTPEEAIKTIQVAIAEVEWDYPMNYAEAFETAIEALEKQISGNHFQNECECITYQQAEIERLKKILSEEEEKYKLCAKRFYKVGVKDFAEKLKSTYFIDSERLCCQVDKVFKEMVGDTE